MKKYIFLSLFLFMLSLGWTATVYAEGPFGQCNEDYAKKYGNDVEKCAKDRGNSNSYCKSALCNPGRECANGKCVASATAPEYFCKCTNGTNSSADNKNGFRCGTDANNIPANAPEAFCSNGKACIPSGNADVNYNDIVGKDNGPVPYPNNAKLKGVACEQPRAVAQCRCVTPGKGEGFNNFECTLSDQSGVKGTGFCKESNHTCSTTANPDEILDENLAYKYNDAMDSGDYIIKGVRCAQPEATCKCNTPGISGNRLNGFKCMQTNASKPTYDIDYCTDTEEACIDDTNGVVRESEKKIFAGAPLRGVRCEKRKPSPPPQPPCAAPLVEGKCTAFASGFGTINTDAGSFITSIFALLLSISGGIALLLIIKSGYQLMTSSGKPEQVNAGREQLIAAIVGLLFIIFSFVILEVIGINILRLPDFTGQNQVGAGGTCSPSANNCANGYVCNYNGSTGQCVKASQ